MNAHAGMNAYTLSQVLSADALWRLPTVKAVTGLGRSTIYRRMEQGDFPESYQLGGGAVAWKRSEVEKWMAERAPTQRPSK